MSVKKIAEAIFPFLFSKMEIEWDKLSKEEQDALVSSGQVGQILKEQIANGEQAVVSAIAGKTGLTEAETQNTLLVLAKAMGFDVPDVGGFIDKLQAEIDKGLSDPDWDNLWENVTGTLMAIAGGNAIGIFAAIGNLVGSIGKFVYDKFIKKT